MTIGIDGRCFNALEQVREVGFAIIGVPVPDRSVSSLVVERGVDCSGLSVILLRLIAPTKETFPVFKSVAGRIEQNTYFADRNF